MDRRPPHAGPDRRTSRSIVGDTLFTICPWWDGPLARERIAAQLAADAAQADRPLVLGPPRAARQLADELGRQPLFRRRAAARNGSRLYQPDIVFSGHVHQSPFTRAAHGSTGSAPPGCSMPATSSAAPPAHIVLDTDEAGSSLDLGCRRAVGPPRPAARSGRSQAPAPFPAGSLPGSGCRSDPGVNSGLLVVDQAGEHLAHHAEVVALALRTGA